MRGMPGCVVRLAAAQRSGRLRPEKDSRRKSVNDGKAQFEARGQLVEGTVTSLLFRSLLLVAFLPFGVACQHRLEFPVAQGEPLWLIVRKGDDYCERQLTPESTEYRAVLKWIGENSTGWDSYLATDPSDGIFIAGRGWTISFSNGGALAKTSQGLFSKSVVDRQYEHLKCPVAT